MSGRKTRLFGRAPAVGPTSAAAADPTSAAAADPTSAAGADPTDQRAADAGPAPSTEPEGTADFASAPAAALIIDALGRKCPIPIIMLAEQIRSVPLGAIVAVLADDPAAYTDIPSWCMMKAHEFAGHQELPQGGWALYIRRAL